MDVVVGVIIALMSREGDIRDMCWDAVASVCRRLWRMRGHAYVLDYA